MQFYIRNDRLRDTNELGQPVLLYTGYMDERVAEHPRGIHSHRDIVEILLITDREGTYVIDGKRYPVGKGDLIIYNGDVLHDETGAGHRQLPNYFCAAAGVQIKGLPKNHLISAAESPVIHLGDKAHTFRSLFQTLYEESCQENARSADICQSLFMAMMGMILNLIDTRVTDKKSTAYDPGHLGNRIKDYVNAHYQEALSVQSVADIFEISASYLSHVFKQATGHSLIQYIIRRRIGEAQTLLISTNKSIREVAAEVGYDNTSYFNTLFVRGVGMSPLSYRKMYRAMGLE